MSVGTRVAGVWKDVPKAGLRVNVAGVWKSLEQAFVNVAGVWKPLYDFSLSIPTVTMDASGGSTGTLAIPTPNVGDLMVLVIRQSGDSTDRAAPAGWTKLWTFANGGVSVGREYVLSRISDGTETTVPNISGTINRRFYYCVRGTQPIASATISGNLQQITASDPTPQLSDSDTGPLPFVTFAIFMEANSAVVVTPRVFTIGGSDVADADLQLVTWFWMKYKIFNPGATLAQITVDMNDMGTGNTLATFTIRPSP